MDQKTLEQLIELRKTAAVGESARGVAHNINNPITGILNYAELIAGDVPDDSEIKEFAEGIIEESLRVAEIVRSLLTFARQTTVTAKPVSPEEALNSTLTLAAYPITRDGITINKDIASELPDIQVPEAQIQQIIMQVLFNARTSLNLRFNNYEPEKCIDITIKADNDRVCYSISDHGIGFDPANIEELFIAGNSMWPEQRGFGLGLFIARGLCHNYNGELEVSCRPNDFFEVKVSFPAYNASSR
jgi:signal transduction histidine kinase